MVVRKRSTDLAQSVGRKRSFGKWLIHTLNPTEAVCAQLAERRATLKASSHLSFLWLRFSKMPNHKKTIIRQNTHENLTIDYSRNFHTKQLWMQDWLHDSQVLWLHFLKKWLEEVHWCGSWWAGWWAWNHSWHSWSNMLQTTVFETVNKVCERFCLCMHLF